MFDRLQIVNSSSDINNMQHMVILRNIPKLPSINLTHLNFGIRRTSGELKLSVDSLVSQIETESNRSPRLFAKKARWCSGPISILGNQKILKFPIF